MLLRQRQDSILSALQADGAASVRDLAQILNVSESTIRRDLEILDKNGELTRTYGGAVVRPRATVEDGESLDEGHYAAEADVHLKEAIADAAAGLVSDGQVVLLDIGTTTPLIARRLRGRDVTVITSSLAVFDELRDDDAVRLLLLGGVVRRNYRTLVGSLTELALTQVSADVLFLSCTGVRSSGHVVDNMAVEAPIKQSMIAASDRVVLLASEKKFPGTGALRLCSITDIDVMITTAGAPEELIEMCRNSGGEVVIA
ncbi:DeoR/GlpR family DNA-binding transcription regulator [Microbacterium rhizosphaerae]|uniref:DeoR/GlpR family DNA-binding transcription regulator n=1 Tax=Microbacterium rhizosphaerae TaxID=1678237 RepID=A0ABZ0SPT8_9MICO|nr:DeoR/GlpR family DNA-binding transcription regulator [Microbacterium rhizosphaerae]WPR89657.1 DeoR/GlpR family DNA-binding transcription regulator [Microbacterium rhizosphaerae]